MEVDKKRKKRVARGDVAEGKKRDRLKKLKGEEDDGGAGGSGGGVDGGDAVVVPTEEEVEEFFAILRRMRVAVKYFDQKGRGGKEWREVLEQAEVTVEDDENAIVDDDDRREAGCGAVKKKNKRDDEVIINEGLDLNAVAPEADDGGDAQIWPSAAGAS